MGHGMEDARVLHEPRHAVRDLDRAARPVEHARDENRRVRAIRLLGPVWSMISTA
jgi:hypothetical protein